MLKMEIVQPIRDKNKIKQMIKVLSEYSQRDCMLFIMGINSGLRISDILARKVKDVKNKTHIHIMEKKTKKYKRFYLNTDLREALKKYIESLKLSEDDYLFQSRKGDNKPISRIQAYRILNKAAKEVGLKEIGTHTMRKTFGYWHYKKYKDVAMLQKIFNHSAPSITLAYIGITDEYTDETIEGIYK